MPTRPFNILFNQNPNSIIVEWTGLLDLDDGEPFFFNDGAGYIWVEASGVFGTGGSVRFEGGIDGTTWGLMIQENNSGAIFTFATGTALRGTPRRIRPNVTAGTGVNLTARLYFAGIKTPG